MISLPSIFGSYYERNMKMNSMSGLPVHVKEGVPTSLPVGYRHLVVSTPKMLTIYLHGYADHGGSLRLVFFRRLSAENGDFSRNCNQRYNVVSRGIWL